MTKEDIKKRLEENPDWTLPDDATDEDWDLYFEVKDEMGVGEEVEDDSWDDSEDGI